MILKTACEADFGPLCVLSCIRMTAEGGGRGVVVLCVAYPRPLPRPLTDAKSKNVVIERKWTCLLLKLFHPLGLFPAFRVPLCFRSPPANASVASSSGTAAFKVYPSDPPSPAGKSDFQRRGRQKEAFAGKRREIAKGGKREKTRREIKQEP